MTKAKTSVWKESMFKLVELRQLPSYQDGRRAARLRQPPVPPRTLEDKDSAAWVLGHDEMTLTRRLNIWL
jgi:hypothetical protein